MENRLNEEWIALTASDGHRLGAFRAAPEGKARGMVVVLQEIFGVNSHIQNVARRLAREGYLAIAPALFDRTRKDVNLKYDQAGIKQGLELKSSASFDNALLDVAAALEYGGPGKNAVVLGFCWGGTLAWLAATKLPVRAAVAYYGGQIGSFLDVKLQAPVLAHFGEQDHSIPLSVSSDMAEWYPYVLNHLYPAGHGFNCDERESFHPECAALAWTRTAGFLKTVF